MRARRFNVSLEPGEAIAKALDGDAPDASGRLVPGPYMVEKFPVRVEDEYIVVTMRPRGPRSATDAAP
jgi:hypothetical protein